MSDDSYSKQRSYAFVTPSYRGDFERCRLLCESTTRFLPEGIEHVLIVDRRDFDLFSTLQNGTVRIVEAESLLPWWIFRVPGVRGWWASLRSLPVRNWIYQQMLKLSAFQVTDAEIIQFVDSDVTLTRPFPSDYLVRDGRVRLQCVAYQDQEHANWLRVASSLLGVPDAPIGEANYIGNLITWTRSNAIGMVDRISEVAGTSYFNAIARSMQFSEYMTYGVYVDSVVGIEASGHFYDDSPNLHLCWGYDLTTDAGMRRYLAEIGPENFGVMIHSKYGIPVKQYRSQIESIWEDA